MHVFRSFAFVVVALGLAASPSVAQQRPSAPPQPLRGYLIGGGGTSIGAAIGRAYVDVGYRYRKAFHVGQSFDISQVGVAVGLKF